MAHLGVLFLDELSEFRRRVLEDLRQPLDDGSVTVARSVQSATFPATFMFVAAMNPCFRNDLPIDKTVFAGYFTVIVAAVQATAWPPFSLAMRESV